MLIIDTLARCDAGPADLLRAWRRPRGVNRSEFVAAAYESFFGEELSNLWSSEVHDVASATFDQIMRTIVGENFLRKISIVHLDRWLGFVKAKGVAAPRYSVDALPLKSRSERRRQHALRRTRMASGPSFGRAPSRKIDWAAKAKADIEAAAAAAVARERDRIEQLRMPHEIARHGSLPPLSPNAGGVRWPPSLEANALATAEEAVRPTVLLRAMRVASSPRGVILPGGVLSPNGSAWCTRAGWSSDVQELHSTSRSAAASITALSPRQQRSAFLANIRSVRKDLEYTIHGRS